MGTHVTFVRSVDLDKWSREQLIMMTIGGNERAAAGFASRGWSDMRGRADAKYNSHAAADYRAQLKAASQRHARAGRTAWDLIDASGADLLPAASPVPDDDAAAGSLGSAWVDLRTTEAEETADDARKELEATSKRLIVLKPAKGSLSVAGIAAGGATIKLGGASGGGTASGAEGDGSETAPAGAKAPSSSAGGGDDPFGDADDWGFGAASDPAAAAAAVEREREDAKLAAALQAQEMGGHTGAPGGSLYRTAKAAVPETLGGGARSGAGHSGGGGASGPAGGTGGGRAGPSGGGVAKPAAKRPGLGAVGAVSGAARADRSGNTDRSRITSVGVGKPGLGMNGEARPAARPGLGGKPAAAGSVTTVVAADATAARDDFFDQW